MNRKDYYFLNHKGRAIVAIHELGHTHGLDHTSCVDEIMSNNEDRDIYQVNLGDGDIAGIKDI